MFFVVLCFFTFFDVAVLWEVIFNFLRIGNRSLWGLGGPGGPGDHSAGWGASPPTFWKGFNRVLIGFNRVLIGFNKVLIGF